MAVTSCVYQPQHSLTPDHVLMYLLPHLSEQQCSVKQHWYASHIKDIETKKLTGKGNRAGKHWWYYSLFRIIYISGVTLTTFALRHQVSHINHSVTWAISILRAVILKEFKKRFMKAPEWSLPSGLVENHFFCGKVLWYSLGTMGVL